MSEVTMPVCSYSPGGVDGDTQHQRANRNRVEQVAADSAGSTPALGPDVKHQ
jgi:hypothetical protein